MKKLIAILVLLSVMIGLSVWEMTATARSYRTLHTLLIAVENSLDENEDATDNPDTIARMDAVNAHWGKCKRYLLMTSNHTIVRSLDEKLISLDAWVRTNGYQDAKALAEVTIALSEDLSDDLVPGITNLM